jgi:hypothetical protein
MAAVFCHSSVLAEEAHQGRYDSLMRVLLEVVAGIFQA